MIFEQPFSQANWKKEREMRPSVWSCFICPSCKLIYWHPNGYCHRCPGKTKRMVGPADELRRELTKQGYTEIGY